MQANAASSTADLMMPGCSSLQLKCSAIRWNLSLRFSPPIGRSVVPQSIWIIRKQKDMSEGESARGEGEKMQQK
eukprot:m.6786 g.6786  ORF g.6786 m.6786 type:complete len:74 (+) comp4936_c0_seq2:218-439(+)